jgi:hypothetical protein
MVHTINIFVLYVGTLWRFKSMHMTIISEVSGHVYIYPNPLGHTLKSFASIEYEFGKEGDS